MHVLATCHAPWWRNRCDVIFVQLENLIRSETMHNGRILSIEHSWKVYVALPESASMNYQQHPWRRNHCDFFSSQQKNLIILQTVHHTHLFTASVTGVGASIEKPQIFIWKTEHFTLDVKDKDTLKAAHKKIDGSEAFNLTHWNLNVYSYFGFF